MEKYVYGLLPFSDKNKTYVLKEIYNIVKANALGIPLLAFIQGGIAMAGYFIFGVPNAFFWGVITCFTTIIPIVGTALVWIPLSIYFALLGSWPQAIGLLAYTSIIVTNVDNLIRFMPHNSSFSSKNEIGVLKSSCILIKKNLAHIVVSIDSIFPPIL